MKMNLPNKLTVLRLILVPVFVVVMMISDALWASAVGLALFVIASFTDMLDGKIARKYNLVTDFGKFMDPLADKFMVIGAMLVILYQSMTREEPNGLFCAIFFWAVMLVIFRELAVTSIRLVVSGSSGIVIAANMLGKIKTVTQIVALLMALLEPAIEYLLCLAFDYPLAGVYPLTILTIVISTFFTLWSGISYIWSYRGYLKQK